MANRTQEHVNESAKAKAVAEARRELAEAEEQLRKAQELVEQRRARLTRLTAPPVTSPRRGKSKMWK